MQSLTTQKKHAIIIYAGVQKALYLGVAQLVACYLGVVEAARSSRVTQTRINTQFRRFFGTACFVLCEETYNKILEQHQLTKRRLYTILKCTAFFCISSMRAACFAHCCSYSISPIRSFTTSPAMISPTTDGTKALLPGTCRRWVHLRAVPGGQMQWVLQLFAMSSFGAMGFSLE